MNNVHTANLIKALAKQRGISITALLEKCNLSRNLIYDLSKRGSIPSAEAFEVLADNLDCSVDFLLGRTDVPEINKKESNVINITPKTEFTGELAAFGGDFVSNKKPTKPEIL